MKTTVKVLGIGMLAAAAAMAQAANAAPELPQNYVDVVGICDPQASSTCFVAGSYAHKIAAGTYTLQMADVTWQPFTDKTASGVVRNLLQPKVATTTGLAQLLTVQHGWAVFGVGGVGVQTTPGGGTAAGFTATGGFRFIRPLGTKGWTLTVPIRYSGGTGKSELIVGLGFGLGFGGN